jgi:hypothetical protein
VRRGEERIFGRMREKRKEERRSEGKWCERGV